MTTTSLTTTTAYAGPFSLSRLGVAATAAAALNAVVFTLGSSAGAAMTVRSSAYTDITLPLAVIATLAPLLVAGGITWLIARRRPGFRRIAQLLGTAVALLSMVSPFLVAQDTATGFTLAGMHLVGAAAWFLGLRATATL